MNKRLWVIVGMMVIYGAGLAAAPAPLKVKVLKNNVNLRAKPIPTSEVVGQVSENDRLISKSMDKDWVEVIPPSHVDLWVLSDYVKDEVIQCRQKVNVRAGPGINFSVVGQLAQGDKVTVRGAFAEWIKIAPPDNCSLWIARSMVEVVADKPAKLETAKVEPAKVESGRIEPPKSEPVKTSPVKGAGELAAVKPPTPKPTPPQLAVPVIQRTNEEGISVRTTESAMEARETAAVSGKPPPDLPSPAEAGYAKAGLDLIPSLWQGQWKQYEGTLRPRGYLCRTPSRFRLVTYDQDNNATTVCYVKGNNAQLSALINRPMIISGREYWVKKQRYPVLIPERIVLK